jgi:LemA protein
MIELIIAVGGLVVLLVIAMVVIGMYNNLVRLREQVRSAWAQIDVVLKRRYDLIPNLVETVKGYASHEKETLERVMQARNAAVTARHDPAAASQAEGMLTGALRQLFAVAEAYPDLKANTNFLELQRELASTENQISGQRQQYNNDPELPDEPDRGPIRFHRPAVLRDPGQRPARSARGAVLARAAI